MKFTQVTFLSSQQKKEKLKEKISDIVKLLPEAAIFTFLLISIGLFVIFFPVGNEEELLDPAQLQNILIMAIASGGVYIFLLRTMFEEDRMKILVKKHFFIIFFLLILVGLTAIVEFSLYPERIYEASGLEVISFFITFTFVLGLLFLIAFGQLPFSKDDK